jgi:hypothetical protein
MSVLEVFTWLRPVSHRAAHAGTPLSPEGLHRRPARAFGVVTLTPALSHTGEGAFSLLLLGRGLA